jgi:hypothetical protein
MKYPEELKTNFCRGCKDAADLIEALRAALREAYEVYAGMEGFIPEELLTEKVKVLEAAGDKLGYYAGHTDDCEDVTGAYPGSCSCGYRFAWKQWRKANGDKQ